MNRTFSTENTYISESTYKLDLSSDELYILQVICNYDRCIYNGGTFDCEKKDVIEGLANMFSISDELMKEIIDKYEKLGLLIINESKVCDFEINV